MDQELLEKVMNQVKAELGAAATPLRPLRRRLRR